MHRRLNPTQSRTLYQQMIPRGTWLCPGKADCLILDVVGLSSRNTLQTAAVLFDVDAKKLVETPLAQVVAEPLQVEAAEQAAIKGTLHRTPVDLFARRVLRWVQTRLGAWVLSGER